jgi:hypothetical protein
MPMIQQPTEPAQYDPTRRSEVVGVAPASLHSVAWVNAEGRKSMCLVIVFGKDTEDGGPGVFILADQEQMSEQLRIANVVVKKGVRRWLAGEQATRAADVPAGLGNVDLGPAEAEDEDPLKGILP